MYTATRMASLLSLLALEPIRTLVKNMYGRLCKHLGRKDQSERGTRSRETTLPTPFSDPTFKCVPGKSILLHDSILDGLCSLLNKEDSGGAVVYIPASSPLRGPGQIQLHAAARRLRTLTMRSVTYKSLSQSLGDSNVMLHADAEADPGPSTMPYRPARILQMFSHVRVLSGGPTKSEEFCVVQFLNPLPDELRSKDWFRKQGPVGGSLWSQTFNPKCHVIRASSVVCHYARTPLDLSELGGPTFHVLPLDRVSSA